MTYRAYNEYAFMRNGPVDGQIKNLTLESTGMDSVLIYDDLYVKTSETVVKNDTRYPVWEWKGEV